MHEYSRSLIDSRVGGTYPFEQYQYSATTGNLSSKAGVSYTYAAQSSSCPAGALSKPHAVTTAGSNTYCYDQNGNMVRRTLGGSVYNLTYDAENHLTGVSGPGVNVSFVYGGDGNRVKADWVGSPDHTIIAYIGNTYEYQKVGTTTTVRKYYYVGITRVAMRTGVGTNETGLLWLLGDHLGSSHIAANENGSLQSEQLYKPWGEKRYPSGASGLPTTYRYTGQRQESSLGGTDGLYFYGARWLDPALGRFVQADSIVPRADNPLDWDRYSYTRNNPLKFVDPSGHRPEGECDGGRGCNFTKREEFLRAWYKVAASLEKRAKWDRMRFEREGRDTGVAGDAMDFILSGDNPMARLYFSSWAASRLMQGGNDSRLAAMDLLLITTSNTGTGLMGLAMGADIAPVGAGIIYRSGGTNPGNLKPRLSDEGMLSFRDSISNPWPLKPGQRPVFSPGDDFIAVDSTKLPIGSVIFDNNPAGHVSVNGLLASVEAIKNATLGIFRFP